LTLALIGLPILLAATGAPVAGIGIAVAGMGIGATFPLISAMHIESSPRGSDQALGQILAVAAVGQVVGPLSVGVIAQLADLRAGLAIALAYVALAFGALILLRRRTAPDAGDGAALAPACDCA
jgi:fucose permease